MNDATNVNVSMDNLRALIKEAIDAGKRIIHNGYDKSKFQKVERRLYSYTDKKEMLEKYKQDIDDLKKEGFSGRSKDIVIMKSSTTRLSPEEIQEAKVLDIESKKLQVMQEVRLIEWAVDRIRYKDSERKVPEEGWEIIELKYFKRMTTEEIADELHISDSTVKRWKNKLINRLITFLDD